MHLDGEDRKAMGATVLSCPVSDQVHKSSVSIHRENDPRIAVFILPSVPVAVQQRIASKWDDVTGKSFGYDPFD